MWHPFTSFLASNTSPQQAIERTIGLHWFAGRTWKWVNELLGTFRLDGGFTLYRVVTDGPNRNIEWE
jgi:hypothetical protein